MKRISLSLTDQLHAFIREKKERADAAELREGIVEGYRDLIEGRVVEFAGNLRKTMKEANRRYARRRE